MAILIPSLTTPQGDVVSNVYAKVVSSDYSNRGSDDPVLTGAVHMFKSKEASDAFAAPYTAEGFSISPWAPGAARGRILAFPLPTFEEGDYFALNDGVNPPVNFVFHMDDSPVVDTATLRHIHCGGATALDAAAAAEHLASVIRNTPRDDFFIRVASVQSNVIHLINCYAKAAGNVSPVVSVSAPGFAVTAMTGGANLVDIGEEVEKHLLTLPMFAGGTRV